MRFGSGMVRGDWQNAFSGVADEDRTKFRDMTEALRSGDTEKAKQIREGLNQKYPNLFRSGAEMLRGRRMEGQEPSENRVPDDAWVTPVPLPGTHPVQ